VKRKKDDLRSESNAIVFANRFAGFYKYYGLGNMRHLNRYLLIASLLFTALTVEAVQLGSAKGAAVFGRPLDLSVQVRLDAPAEEAANCFSAEVFQADNKFDVGRVRLDVTPAANGLDATVRVRSATAVNEPWAKVILRSNCGAKVSRQYDFLTDFATDIPAGNMLADTTPNLPATSTNSASSATASAATTGTAFVQAPVSNWSVKRSQAKAKASQQKTKSIELTPAIAANGSKKTSEMIVDAMGQSRLKMETFELSDEHQVLLKLSTALVAPTGMRTPEEIQALAQATAVWRAINGMPPEIKETKTPAIDPVAATQVTANTAATPPVTIPTLMNQKLAGKGEFSNLMVYGLIGLLALTLGCIAWLWLRVRKATRAGYGWLNNSETEDQVAEHEQTQFLHSNFYETETVDQEELEPGFDAEQEQIAELKQEIVIEEKEFNDEARPAAVFTSDKPVVNSLPAHFDDPRFDERVLRVKKKDRNLTHEKPITSSSELMDLVLADTPPKLRSVATSSPEPLNKASVTKAIKAATTKETKDDPKGNLIDFDVFAEPEPLNKPTRFVR
jgi:hypothetical protein